MPSATRRWPWVTLAIALIAGVIHAVPGAAEACQLQASSLHETWRLLTGHLAHWSGDHLVWDVLTFVALGIACELIDRRRTLIAMLISAISVSVAMLALQPSITVYRGLSGIDSALFGMIAAMTYVRRGDRLTRVAVPMFAGLFVVKTLIELASGGAVFVDSSTAGFVSTPLAHLAGVACGAIVGAFTTFAPRGRIATIARA